MPRKESRYKIFSLINGRLQLNLTNLQDTIQQGKKSFAEKYKDLHMDSLPVAITSMIGGTLENEAFFFTNLLVCHAGNEGKTEDSQLEWIQRLKKDDIKKAKRKLLQLKMREKSHDETTGIFLWPEPFLVNTFSGSRHGQQQVLLWILYPHYSDKHKIGMDVEIEMKIIKRFLAFVCSKITEIYTGKNLYVDDLKGAMTLQNTDRFVMRPSSICEGLFVLLRTRVTDSNPPWPQHCKEAEFIPIDDKAIPLFDNQGKLLPEKSNLDYHLPSLKDVLIKMTGNFPPKFVISANMDDRECSRYLQNSDLVKYLRCCWAIFSNPMCIKVEKVVRPLPEDDKPMEDLLKQALQEITSKVSTSFCESWAEVNFFPENPDSHFAINWDGWWAKFSSGSLQSTYKDRVEARLWNKFSLQLFTKLKERFKKMFDTLRTINLHMESYFMRHAYLSPVTLATKFEEERSVTKIFDNEDGCVSQAVHLAVYKMKQKFEEHNLYIMEVEAGALKGTFSKLKTFYDEQMTKYLEIDLYGPSDLRGISDRLIDELLISWKGCIRVSNSDYLDKKEDLDDNKRMEAELRKMLNAAFPPHLKLHRAKIDRHSDKVKKAISKGELKYMESMEDILKGHSMGVEESFLNTMHAAVFEELLNDLKRTLWNIRESEPVELHCDALRFAMNSYWEHVKEDNRKNLGDRAALPPALESEYVHVEKSFPEPPIVFHLTHDGIIMGSLDENIIHLVKKKCGNEYRTPLVVGIDELNGNKFVYGSDIRSQRRSNFKTYDLSALFESGPGNDEVDIKETFLIENSSELGSRTANYLFGYLLRSLKSTMKRVSDPDQTFSTAWITVPSWISQNSLRRNQFQQAAIEHAHFTEVKFINQAEAAVHHCTATNVMPSSSGNILVIGESLGKLDVTLVSYYTQKNLTARVNLVAHDCVSVRKGSGVNLGQQHIFINEVREHVLRVLNIREEINGRYSHPCSIVHYLMLPCSKYVNEIFQVMIRNTCFIWWNKLVTVEDMLVLQGVIDLSLSHDITDDNLEDSFELVEVGIEASEGLDAENVEDFYDCEEGVNSHEGEELFYDCEVDTDDTEVSNEQGHLESSSESGDAQQPQPPNENNDNILESLPKELVGKLSKDKLDLLKKCDEIQGDIENGVIQKSGFAKTLALQTIKSARDIGMNEHSAWRETDKAMELLSTIA